MRRLVIVLAVLLLGGATAALAANPAPPTATTGAASGVTQHEAAIAGSVVPGGADATVQFEYGTSTAYGLTTPAQTLAAGDTAQPVTAALSGLTTSTTYHYRVVATNAAGTARGADRTFRTAAAPRAPGVSRVAAQDVGPDAATLTANVNAYGQPTTYVIEYGTTSAYGAATAPADAGSGTTAVAVAQRITGLAPATTYHARIDATNAAGTTRGADHTFRTASIPLTLSLSASPQPVPYGRLLTVRAHVDGTGAAGRSVALQSRPFPFAIDWRGVGVARRTSSTGDATFTVPPFTATSQFRVVSGGASSSAIVVGVRPRVTMRFRHQRGGRVRLSGTVRPATAQGPVSIQRQSASGRWVTLRRVQLHRDRGVLRYGTTFGRHARRGLVRAVLPARGALLGASSATHRLPRAR